MHRRYGTGHSDDVMVTLWATSMLNPLQYCSVSTYVYIIVRNVIKQDHPITEDCKGCLEMR